MYFFPNKYDAKNMLIPVVTVATMENLFPSHNFVTESKSVRNILEEIHKLKMFLLPLLSGTFDSVTMATGANWRLRLTLKHFSVLQE